MQCDEIVVGIGTQVDGLELLGIVAVISVGPPVLADEVEGITHAPLVARRR
jgi:hypothetical protein